MKALTLLMAFVLMVGFVSAAVDTVVTGTVYDGDGNEVVGADVSVDCNGNMKYDTSDSDGLYSVAYDLVDCAGGDYVEVAAEKDSVGSGSASGYVCDADEEECPFNVALIDVTIPEFGVLAGAVALIGALGIIAYKRQ